MPKQWNMELINKKSELLINKTWMNLRIMLSKEIKQSEDRL